MTIWKQLPVVNKVLYPINLNIPHNLIGIHGILYDISDFKHPGGNVFTQSAKGLDVTSLYETHHIRIEKANKLLATLPVKGTYTRQLATKFDTYRDLRKHVAFLVRKTDKDPWLWFTFALCIHILQCITSSYYLIPLSAIVSTIVGGYGHNSVHVMRPTAMLLDWNGLSAYEWLFEHIMSHHMYTHTDNDHDALSMEPFIRWLPHRPKRFLDTFITKHIVYAVGEIVVAIQGLLIHRTRWQLRKSFIPLWLKLAPFIFIVRTATLLYFCGITITLCTYSLASYIFSYLAHLNHGSDRIPRTDDFVEQQLSSTQDIDNYLGLPGWALLFLDRQVAHHLFPTIDQRNNQFKNIIRTTLNNYYYNNERQTNGRISKKNESCCDN